MPLATREVQLQYNVPPEQIVSKWEISWSNGIAFEPIVPQSIVNENDSTILLLLLLLLFQTVVIIFCFTLLNDTAPNATTTLQKL